MKINDGLPPHNQDQAVNTRRKDSQSADFSKALSEIENRTADRSSSVNSVKSPAHLLEASFAGRLMAVRTETRPPAQQLDQALGALDQFAQALADPTRSLKDLAPMVKDLEQQAENLNRLSSDLPPGHGLKSLAQQTAILASVEAIKFNRGDYS